MDQTAFLSDVTVAIEVLGVSILVISIALAFLQAAYYLVRGRGTRCAYDALRKLMGRGILLGLEILVVADLIRTVAIEPTLDNVIALGIIVLIRTFLSFSLEIELDGELPWRKARSSSAERF